MLNDCDPGFDSRQCGSMPTQHLEEFRTVHLQAMTYLLLFHKNVISSNFLVSYTFPTWLCDPGFDPRQTVHLQ